MLITITGPTGSGKTTLARKLKEEMNLYELVSCTTRPPRKGEVDGKDYKFLGNMEMDHAALVEHIEYAGFRYGLDVDEVEIAKHRPSVVVVNPEGREAVESFCKDHGIELLRVYVSAPPEVLTRRLLDRDFGEVSLYRRIVHAIREHDLWQEPKKYDMIFTHFDGEEAMTNALGKIHLWVNSPMRKAG